jgi:hypothetical protein
MGHSKSLFSLTARRILGGSFCQTSCLKLEVFWSERWFISYQSNNLLSVLLLLFVQRLYGKHDLAKEELQDGMLAIDDTIGKL